VTSFKLDKVKPPFAECIKCGAIFREPTALDTTANNDIKAKEMDLVTEPDTTMCLFHPGTYEGYGHSCSSFQCCGSNTPSYRGTPGCVWAKHEASISGKDNIRFRHYERMEYPLEVQHTVADMEFWEMCREVPLLSQMWRRASGMSYEMEEFEKLRIYFF